MRSDDDIIRSVIAGHTSDYEILIERYSTRIFHFIRRLIGDSDDAENLAQDVFIRIYENLDKYRLDSNFQAFIFTVAKNLSLNWIKKRKRIIFFSQLGKTDFQRQEFASSAQPQSSEEAERNMRLDRALATLGEEQRLALILKVYLNFSYDQIAAVTGWSIAKIETLISRAKARLKKNIDLQENPERAVKLARGK